MFDLLIRNGQVVDGLGNPRRRADVGIVGDKIASVDDLAVERAPAPSRPRGSSSAPASWTFTPTPTGLCWRTPEPRAQSARA